MDLNISIEQIKDDFILLKLAGELDAFTAHLKLVKNLQELVKNSDLNLLVDMEQVGYIDSVGVSVLVSAADKLRKNKRDIKLIYSRNSGIYKFLKITELDRSFTVFTSLKDAFAQLGIPRDTPRRILQNMSDKVA